MKKFLFYIAIALGLVIAGLIVINFSYHHYFNATGNICLLAIASIVIYREYTISVLKDDLEDLDASISKLTDYTSKSLERTNCKLDQSLESLEKSVKNLDTKSSTTDKEVKTLKSNITSLRNSIGYLRTKVDEILSILIPSEDSESSDSDDSSSNFSDLNISDSDSDGYQPVTPIK